MAAEAFNSSLTTEPRFIWAWICSSDQFTGTAELRIHSQTLHHTSCSCTPYCEKIKYGKYPCIRFFFFNWNWLSIVCSSLEKCKEYTYTHTNTWNNSIYIFYRLDTHPDSIWELSHLTPFLSNTMRHMLLLPIFFCWASEVGRGLVCCPWQEYKCET